MSEVPPHPGAGAASPGIVARLAAWTVHALTASGAVWGLLAILAITEGRYKAALGWMGVAVLIDALDGPLARRAGVAEALPRIDGTLLDNLIDYLNYVVVPALFILRLDVLPAGLELAGAAAICVASGFQFSHLEAKSERMFRGFPSYWNVVAVYLLLLRPAPWLALVVVLVLCAMVFVPLRYVYPSRTRQYRGLTLSLTAVWVLCLVLAAVRYPDHDHRLVWASLLYGVYYVGISLKIGAEHRRHRA